MAEASASVVFTGNQGGIGDNTGSAAILDKAQDFMPYAERALVRRDQQKRIDAQAKAQKEQDRKKGWYNLAKTIEAGDIWRPAVDKQNEMMNNIFVEMTDLVQKGFNPEDVYSEAGKKFLERKKELELFTKEQQTAEGLVKGYYQKINDPKLKGLVDEDFAQDWFSKLEALPVEQKAEFAMTSSPILPKVNYDDIMPVLTPKSTTTVDQNGMTRTTTVSPNKESIGILVDKGLDGNPQVQQVYEAGIVKGDWSDKEGFKDYFTEKIIAKEGSKNSEVIVGSTTSNNNSNGGSNSDYSVTASYNSKFDPNGKMKGKTNAVTIIPNTQNVKAIPFFDGQKQYVSMGQFTVHQDIKDGNESFVVEADVYDPDEEGKVNYLTNQPVYTKTRKKFYVDPNEMAEGGANTNYKTVSSLIGEDLQNYIGREVGGAKPSGGQAKSDSGSKYTIKGKTYTLSQLEGMGYTKEQVEQYKAK